MDTVAHRAVETADHRGAEKVPDRHASPVVCVRASVPAFCLLVELLLSLAADPSLWVVGDRTDRIHKH